LQKDHVENLSQNFDKNFDVSFYSTFLFYRVFRCFLGWDFKSTTKKVLPKKSCRKSFTKKSTNNSNPIFSRLFLSRFGAFLGEGSSKTKFKKTEIINLTLVLFWPLTHPPTTGVPGFFCGPLLAWQIACIRCRRPRHWISAREMPACVPAMDLHGATARR
jgi:hypothetical protein